MVKKMEKVLVVDDQPGMRLLLEQVLTETGYFVETAPDGVNGLKIIGDVNPRAVLVDMKMPGMTGLDFVEQIHAKCLYPEIILMTAYRDTEILNRADRLGVKHCLIKPFDIEDLLQVMDKVMHFGRNSFVAGE